MSGRSRVSTLSWISGNSGLSRTARGTGGSRRAVRLLDGTTLAIGRHLTLLTEDGVERVLARLGRRSHGDLHFHQIGPGGVGVHAEGLTKKQGFCLFVWYVLLHSPPYLHSIVHFGGQLVDLREQRLDHHQCGHDGNNGAHRGNPDRNTHLMHCLKDIPGKK